MQLIFIRNKILHVRIQFFFHLLCSGRLQDYFRPRPPADPYGIFHNFIRNLHGEQAVGRALEQIPALLYLGLIQAAVRSLINYNCAFPVLVHIDVCLAAWQRRVKQNAVHMNMIFNQARIEFSAVHIVSKAADHIHLPAQLPGPNRLIGSFSSRKDIQLFRKLGFSFYRYPGSLQRHIHIHAAYNDNLFPQFFLGRMNDAPALCNFRRKLPHQFHLFLRLNHLRQTLCRISGHLACRKPDCCNPVAKKFQNGTVAHHNHGQGVRHGHPGSLHQLPYTAGNIRGTADHRGHLFCQALPDSILLHRLQRLSFIGPRRLKRQIVALYSHPVSFQYGMILPADNTGNFMMPFLHQPFRRHPSGFGKAVIERHPFMPVKFLCLVQINRRIFQSAAGNLLF